ASETASGGLRNSAIFKLGQSAMNYFRDAREASRFVLMSRHLLYRNEDHFLESYLGNADEAGYLRAPLQPSWEKRLAMFEAALSAIHDKAAAAGVPLAFVYSPSDALT